MLTILRIAIWLLVFTIPPALVWATQAIFYPGDSESLAAMVQRSPQIWFLYFVPCLLIAERVFRAAAKRISSDPAA